MMYQIQREKKHIEVSAIIPVYNGEKFLKTCIESLLYQTYPIKEIIIIDDHSQDNSNEIIFKFNKKYQNIRIFKNKNNKGSSFCRNFGILQSDCKNLLFLDQDDYLDRKCLEKSVNHLEYIRGQYPQYLWAGTHSAYNQVDDYGNIINFIKDWKQVHPNELLGFLFVRNHIISNSGCLLDKELITKCGMYDESLKYSQDWDFFLRISQMAGIAYIDEAMTYIRRHSKNTSKYIEAYLKDERNILKKYNLVYIKEKIFNRKVSIEDNILDYLSILVRLGEYDMLSSNICKYRSDYELSEDINFFLGLYQLKSGLYKEAIDSFSSIDLKSDYYISALNNLGVSYLLCNLKELAIASFNKALNIQPNYNDAMINMKTSRLEDLSIAETRVTNRKLRKNLIYYSGK